MYTTRNRGCGFLSFWLFFIGSFLSPWAVAQGTGSQYQTAYYSNTNTLGAFGPGIAGQLATSQGGAAAPMYVSPGLPGRSVSGTSDTILCDSGTATRDRNSIVQYTSASAVAVTLPQAGSSGCGSNFVFGVMVEGAGTVTITPTTSTITYCNGSSCTSASLSLTLTTGQYAAISSPDNTNYIARVSGISFTNPFVVPNAMTVQGNLTSQFYNGIIEVDQVTPGGPSGCAAVSTDFGAKVCQAYYNAYQTYGIDGMVLLDATGFPEGSTQLVQEQMFAPSTGLMFDLEIGGYTVKMAVGVVTPSVAHIIRGHSANVKATQGSVFSACSAADVSSGGICPNQLNTSAAYMTFAFPHGPGGIFAADNYYAMFYEGGDTFTSGANTLPGWQYDNSGSVYRNIGIDCNGVANFGVLTGNLEENSGLDWVQAQNCFPPSPNAGTAQGPQGALIFMDSQVAPAAASSTVTNFTLQHVNYAQHTGTNGGYGIVLEASRTTISITGSGGGSGATAYPVLGTGGSATEIVGAVLTNGGTAYSGTITCTIEAVLGAGSGATCTATQSGGVINSVTIGTNGIGYKGTVGSGFVMSDMTIVGLIGGNTMINGISYEGSLGAIITGRLHIEQNSGCGVQAGAGTAPTWGGKIDGVYGVTIPGGNVGLVCLGSNGVGVAQPNNTVVENEEYYPPTASIVMLYDQQNNSLTETALQANGNITRYVPAYVLEAANQPPYFLAGLLSPYFLDTGGAEVLELTPTAAGVDYVNVAGSATGAPGSATVSAKGSDSNINLILEPQGTGTVDITGTAPASTTGATGTNAGTSLTVSGVTGGATSNASGVAGAGSPISVTGGNGGAGTGTNAEGGPGGPISLTAGSGGNGLGTSANAFGGNIVLTPGSAGTGGGGLVGTPGAVIFGNGSCATPKTSSAAGLEFANDNQTSTEDTGFVSATAGKWTFCYEGNKTIDLNSNGLELGDDAVYGFSSTSGSEGTQDTAISRKAAGLVDVGTGAQGSAAGFIKTAQTLQVVTSDFTTMSSSFVNIAGLSATLPLVSANWSFTCDLIMSQATGTAADKFGVQTAINGATNTTASGIVYTAAGTSTSAATTDNASSTATFSIVTATPAATGTKLPVHLAGTIEGTSTSGTVLNIMLLTGNISDTITIYRGSSCYVY